MKKLVLYAKKLVALIDDFNTFIGKKISWFNLLTIFLVFIVTFLRYVFNYGNIALQESGLYAHIFIFSLAAAWVLKNNAHVRVDVLYRRFSYERKAWVDLIGTLFLLFPTTIFILWISLDYVTLSWERLEGSPDVGGLHYYYVLKSNILIMFGLLFVQGIGEFLRNLIFILTGNDFKETN